MAHGSRLPNNQVRWVVTVVTDQAGVSVEGATPVLSPDGSKVAFASALLVVVAAAAAVRRLFFRSPGA